MRYINKKAILLYLTNKPVNKPIKIKNKKLFFKNRIFYHKLNFFTLQPKIEAFNNNKNLHYKLKF